MQWREVLVATGSPTARSFTEWPSAFQTRTGDEPPGIGNRPKAVGQNQGSRTRGSEALQSAESTDESQWSILGVVLQRRAYQ